MTVDKDTFFIGWSGGLPPGLVRFYLLVGSGFVLALFLLGLLLGSRVDDPSKNLFAGIGTVPQAAQEGWKADQRFEGALTLKPYPLLHATDASGRVRSVLLSGYGKSGPELKVVTGRVAAVGGLLKRGDVDMLAIDDAPVQVPGEARVPERQSLGRWTAVGEICDGKCYPGGMTPGGGLSHRACAVVCIISEVPAIFVVAEPVAGSSFLLMAGPDGGPMPEALLPYSGKPLELEGDVERVGSMLIFRVDPKKVRLL